MYFKNYLFIFIFLLFSCDNSIENKNLKNFSNPCEFIDLKLEIYQEINIFFDKYSDVDDLEDVEMIDFSKLMKLWQKNDEIDFYIGLNHWDNFIINCANYYIIDSLEKKMNF